MSTGDTPNQRNPDARDATLSLHADLLEHINDAVLVWELDGGITFCNQGAEALYGYTRAETLGRNIHELLRTVHPGSRAEVEQALHRDGAWQGELEHTARDGRRVIVESRQVVRRRDGRTYVMEINRDVTERRRTEDDLRRSEAQLRLVADHAPVFIAYCDRARTFKYVNAAYAARLGLTPDQVIGRPVPEVLGTAAYDSIAPYIETVLAGRAVSFEVVVPYEAIGVRIMQCAYEPDRDGAGMVRGWIAVVLDVTARREVEQAVRANEARFRELADSMPQIVFTATPDGRTDYLNRRWYERTGLPEGDTGDEMWTQALHPDDRDRCLETWYTSVRTGQPYQIEYRFRFLPSNEYRWHLGRALPVRDASGQITHWYGSCTDIHDHRLAQDALKEADRRKDEFLATLAHELRNPLAPLLTALRLLQTPTVDPAMVERAHAVMDRQIAHLIKLVDDLLDLSRVTRGKLELRTERTTIQAAVESAVESCERLIRDRRHDLEISVPETPLYVDGDPTRLAQIVLNLLSNAVKYTPPQGRIRVSAARDGADVVIAVDDNGLGIEPETLERIFEMFVQVESSRHLAQGGLGVGLTLVKRLVELHGGVVSASSEGAGRGSRFTVRLPAADRPQEIAKASALPQPILIPRRILIADDNRDVAGTLEMLLRGKGHDVRIAYDGREVLDVGESFRPEIVLLDIGMPKLDGYETARAMRTRAWGAGATIIAMTGWGQPRDVERSRQAGIDHHLTKPVEPAHLDRLLGEGQA